MALQNVKEHDFTKLLSPKEVAAMIRRSESSLARDRYSQRGIPYIKYNRNIFYRIEDVRQYVARHMVISENQRVELGVVN
jgi:predicted DNA binding CopG/RHH family protein